MFKINEYIMYGNVGVCQVVDISQEKFSNSIKREYYVLNPVNSKNTVIKIPVDNKIIAMRKVLSKEDIGLLINDIDNLEVFFIENERERNAQFKSMLKTGKCEDLFTIIKSLHSDKKIQKSLGKKLSKGDDEIMQTAEKLLNEEFAFVLDILPEEVPNYIKETVK